MKINSIQENKSKEYKYDPVFKSYWIYRENGRILSMKLPETKSVYKAIKSDIKKAVDIENTEFNTVDWLMNKEITNYVYKKIPSMLKSIVGFDVTKFNEVL